MAKMKNKYYYPVKKEDSFGNKMKFGYNPQTTTEPDAVYAKSGKMKCFSCTKSGNGHIGYREYFCSDGCRGIWFAWWRQKIIIKCKSYEEQKFSMSKKVFKRLSKLIYDFCDESVAGRHNISQQSDTYFNMVECLIYGIKCSLEHRSKFNSLKRLGGKQKIPEENEK